MKKIGRTPGRTPRERFERLVDRRADGGCHVWMGNRTHAGLNYGVFPLEHRGRSKRRRTVAHRAAWLLYRGPIPDGLCVLHRCDVPLCVNPDHLFLGTKTDNNEDMVRKRRQRGAPGERNAAAKLTWKSVREIRRRRAAGELLASLAARFQVAEGTISAIALRKNWRE